MKTVYQTKVMNTYVIPLHPSGHGHPYLTSSQFVKNVLDFPQYAFLLRLLSDMDIIPTQTGTSRQMH